MDEQDNLVRKTKVQNKKRYENMLFDYKTTPLTDFRLGKIWEPKVVTKYKERTPFAKPWKEPLRETQTMTDWKEGKVRFDLFLKPKEIVQTDPRKIQMSQIVTEDLEREQVRKTRPRVILTPAAKLDDAGERELKIILEDMYISTSQRALRDGIATLTAIKPVVAPLVPLPAPAVPIKLEKYVPRVVPPEWRMDSAAWDGRQLRAYCQPTREFWSRPRDTQHKGQAFIQ